MVESKEKKNFYITEFAAVKGVSYQILKQAIIEMNLNLPSYEEIGGKDVRQISEYTGAQILDYLHYVDPVDMEKYLKNGSKLSTEISNTLGVSNDTAYQFLHAVSPEWKNFPTIYTGKGRIHIIPERVVLDLFKYRDLGKHRKYLSSWRKSRNQGMMIGMSLDGLSDENKSVCLDEFNHESTERFLENKARIIPNDKRMSEEPKILFRQLRANIREGKIAVDLIGASTLLKLDLIDIAMLNAIINSAIVSYYAFKNLDLGLMYNLIGSKLLFQEVMAIIYSETAEFLREDNDIKSLRNYLSNKIYSFIIGTRA